MRRFIYISVIAALMVVLTTGCFKDEKQGTCMHIALYSQNVADDPILKCTSDIEAYAFKVPKGSKWEVSTWEDALAHCITNKDNSAEQLTEPDIYGTYDPEAEFQVTFELWAHFTFLVIVDKTNKIYATRFYETPMNLPAMNTHLHLYAWRKSGSANGWDVTNPFPDEAREPLVPVEPEPTPDDGTAETTPDDGTEETTPEE